MEYFNQSLVFCIPAMTEADYLASRILCIHCLLVPMNVAMTKSSLVTCQDSTPYYSAVT